MREFHQTLAAIPTIWPGFHSSCRFLCAAISPRISDEEARQLCQAAIDEGLEWEQLFGMAASYFVSPLLYKSLQRRQLTDWVPEDFLSALKAIYDANNQRNQQHRQLLLDATSLLNQEGIEPTLLKGTHSLLELGPDPDCRIMSDVDILIPGGQAELAQSMLKEQGYREEKFHEMEWYQPERAHQLLPLFHPKLPAYLELHRHPFGREFAPDLVDRLLEDVQSIDYQGQRLKVMSLQSRLIYNQFHHYYSNLTVTGLDFRYMAEQACMARALATEQGDLESQVRAMICQTHPDFWPKAELQFRLISQLFGSFPEEEAASQQAVSSSLEAKSSAQMGNPVSREAARKERELLRMMVGDPGYRRYRRLQVLWGMFLHIFYVLKNPKRLCQRLTTLSWYRDLPGKLMSHLKSGKLWLTLK